jgi:hypothetical protein
MVIGGITVGNRTFRHTARQLRSLGISELIGLGLVNRTSYPALPEEMNNPEIECYWRLDVPTLNDERSCPICKGLESLLTLREKASTVQPGLASCIDEIRNGWKLSEPSQSWWDHGIEPIELRSKATHPRLEKKFGFTPPIPTESSPSPQLLTSFIQQQLIDSDGNTVVNDEITHKNRWRSDEVTWNTVFLRTSTQACVYAIEVARTLAEPDYPWRLAEEIAATTESPLHDSLGVESLRSGAAAAVQIAATYLLLCGGDLSLASRELGAKLLIKQLLLLERDVVNESHESTLVQLRRLRGLATLALVNLGSSTKHLISEQIVKLIAEFRLINPETCIALMAVVSYDEMAEQKTDASQHSFAVQVKRLYDELSRNQEDSAKCLIWNFHAITVTERSLKEQFENAVRFFGAASHHGQFAEIKARSEVMQVNSQEKRHGFYDPNAGWAQLRIGLLRAHSIIFHGWQGGVTVSQTEREQGELFRALCNVPMNTINQVLNGIQNTTPVDRPSIEAQAIQSVSKIRTAFHDALIRIEPNQFAEASVRHLKDRLTDCLMQNEKSDLPRVRIVEQLKGFEVRNMRYVLFGSELSESLINLKKEALLHSEERKTKAPDSWLTAADHTAPIWVRIIGTKSGLLKLEMWNLGKKGAQEDDFVKGKNKIATVHQELDTKIERAVIVDDDGERKWFVTMIDFRRVEGGL